ncbi:MAG: hypothetical protein K2W96_01465 [Gemmataceae bacterium]|nr:hypothetical protein [Gemmataceae bacterium]
MSTVRIRTKLESDTPHLPALAPLVGKVVEVLVVEVPPITREEFYGRVSGTPPESPEERDAQEADLRSMRDDPRFERFWPLLDRLLASLAAARFPQADA